MIPEAFHRLGEKLHHLWQHLPLKGLGVLSAALPMVAVVASAVLAFMGNQNRQRMEMAVTRHFEMVERLGDLLTLMLNAETGLRGHLLTQRAEFLEPFAFAQRSLPDELESLRAFIEAEPGAGPRAQKRARLEEIRGTVGQEMTLLAQLRDATAIEAPRAANSEGLSGQLIQSKALMDHLRDQLRAMKDEEKRLLDQRLEEIRQVRRRDYLSISLALLLGLATRAVVFWLFNRRVVRRIEQLTANVRALAASEPLPNAPSGHHDAIGELEQELANAQSQLRTDRQSSTPVPPPGNSR